MSTNNDFDESVRRTKRGCSFVILLLAAVIGVSFAETGWSYITLGIGAMLLFAIAVLVAAFVARQKE